MNDTNKYSSSKNNIGSNYRLKFWILGIVCLVAIVVSVFLGQYSLSPGQVIELILGKSDLTGAPVKVLFEIRLPRLVAAAVVGASLSLSGVSYQGMFRNPMASPDVLGASTGAGFGAALGILMGLSYFGISMSSFVMGIIAVFAAYGVSRLSKGEPVLAMILAGMVVSSLFSAGTSFVKLVADTQEQLPAITYWLMGSLSSIKKSDILRLCIPAVIGMIPLILLRWRINLLTVSEDEARSMGINTTLLRFIVVFCATLLTAASVSVSGMIGWIGLVIPHFCRIIFGYDYRRLVPATMLFGAAFLVIVDDVARLATTQEIPLGILTSFIGAPLFLYLLLSGRNSHVSRG